ncbi:hypothetical protein BJV77DRAFT_962872 [Russula vinacea]|nr:hypothetical protein BJV77DRAFT_962872 [Russula vinacea]
MEGDHGDFSHFTIAGRTGCITAQTICLLRRSQIQSHERNQNTLQIDNIWDPIKSLDADDSPESGPGSLIGPSSVPSSISSSVSSSELPAATPTSSSSTDSSGSQGIVVQTWPILQEGTHHYPCRDHPPSTTTSTGVAAVPADVSASSGSGSQPQPTQSDELEVSPSLSGSPVTMRFYVPISSYFRTTRTPVTQLRSWSTKVFRTGRHPFSSNYVIEHQNWEHPGRHTVFVAQAGLARGYHGLPTV